MTKSRLIERLKFQMIARIAAGLLLEPAAHANATPGLGLPSSDFSIAEDLPGFLMVLAYLLGLLLGISGIIEMKDHKKNPSNTPLKAGALRLASGGILFALPIIYEVIFPTSGSGSVASAATLHKATLGAH